MRYYLDPIRKGRTAPFYDVILGSTTNSIFLLSCKIPPRLSFGYAIRIFSFDVACHTNMEGLILFDELALTERVKLCYRINLMRPLMIARARERNGCLSK